MTRRAAKSAFTWGAASTPPSQTSSKWRSSMARSSSRSKRWRWKGFSKSAGLFGVSTHPTPSSLSTRASSATWGSGSVKCSMRCDEQAPSKLAGRKPEAQGVHLRHPEALGAVAGRRRGGGLGGVVDPDHLAARRRGSGPTRSPGRSPRRGCGPGRCGRARPGSPPRAGPAASRGSPPAGAARPSAGLFVLVTTGALPSCDTPGWRWLLTLPGDLSALLHDHVPHCHRPPGAARGPSGRCGPITGAAGGGSAAAVVLAALAYVPAAGGAPGRRHAGHEDLPLPRPAALPEPGRLHVGPHRRPGHGDPRVHRLPAADGAVLRRLPPARRAGLGGPAAVARAPSSSPPASACSTCRASSACAGPGPTAAALAYMLSPVLPAVRRAASR